LLNRANDIAIACL